MPNKQALTEIATKLHFLLTEKKLHLASAESCTAGLIGSSLADNAGSSKYFLGGIIAYANSIKTSVLDVSEDTLEKFGAVSAECAAEMARGVQAKFKADLGISVTGIAGPDGGSEEKPVGTVYFGLAYQDKVETAHKLFAGDRNSVREQAAEFALELCMRNI